MSSNVCYNFKETGSCKFGDNCRFDHGDGSSAPAARAPRPARRPFRANNNRSTQECYAFAEGNCKFGDNCRFSHGQDSTPAPSSNAGQPRVQRSPEEQAEATQRKQAAFRSQECYNFKETGECQYGDKCKFAHGAADSRDLLAMKRRAAGVCFAWKENDSCRFGDRCRFAHENIEA